jgi:hypothetical protein
VCEDEDLDPSRVAHISWCQAVRVLSRPLGQKTSSQTLQYQQLVDSTDGLINSWLIRKSPYQQLVVDKELIVDKVVLINKDP